MPNYNQTNLTFKNYKKKIKTQAIFNYLQLFHLPKLNSFHIFLTMAMTKNFSYIFGSQAFIHTLTAVYAAHLKLHDDAKQWQGIH